MFGKNKNKKNVDDDTPLLVRLIKAKQWDNVLAAMKDLDGTISKELATMVYDDQDKTQDGGLPLHLACRYGAPLRVLQKMLEQAPETICCTNKAGRLPLHEFCKSDEVTDNSDCEDVVKFLQTRYTDGVAIADQDGNLVLHLACRSGLRRIVPFLCKAYPDSVMIKNKKGSIPVHRAKSVEIVQYFHNQYPLTAQVKLSGETFDDPNQSKFKKNFMKFMPKSDSSALAHAYINHR